VHVSVRRRSLVTVAVVAFLAAVLIAARAAAPFARPGLGYAAKIVCSSVFVGGMAPDRALADLPDEPVARLIRTRVDKHERRVHAAVPLVARREAVYRPGFGCTLEPLVDVPALDTAQPARVTARGPASEPTDTASAYDSVGARMATDFNWPHGEYVPERSRPGPAAAGDAAALLDRLLAESSPYRALDSLIERAFTEPGDRPERNTRAVVIVHRGRIVAERYADGFTARSRFPGWSMTKSVTNALVGILIGEGRLDLAASRLRPEWHNDDDPRSRITLHDLMQMSSGLDFEESYAPTGMATRMLFDAPDAAAFAAAREAVHEPGTRWSYSSGTTNIISQLIRDAFASDSAYHAFPKRALFDRIGMRSAVLEPDAAGTFVGSSFMYATARDWARFGLLYMNDGVWNGERVLPDGWVEYSVAPAPAASAGRYGAQWWLNAGAPADSAARPWSDLPTDFYLARGFEGQELAIVPSHELILVRLGLTRGDSAWDTGAFVRGVIAALTATGADPIIVASEADRSYYPQN
jgi:CubicO group peptidase (beta-lactamase class C family)